MAKVTVVVPTYNAAAYIGQTLESVRAQQHEDWRLIVVDDGSTDGTQQVVEEFCAGDQRIRSVSQERGGPAAARNTGIDLADADTEYFLFLDHDDWLHDTALTVLIEALEGTPDAPAAHGLADEHSESLGRSRISGVSEAYGYERFRISGLTVRKLALDEPTGFDSLVLWSCISTTGQGLIRASALRRIGGFDPATAWSDDWDMWLRLAADHPLVFVPVFVLSKRYHDANLSSGETASPAGWGGGLAVRRKLIDASWLSSAQRAQAKAGWRYEAVMVIGWARAELRQRNYRSTVTTTVRAANAYRRYLRYYLANRLHQLRRSRRPETDLTVAAAER